MTRAADFPENLSFTRILVREPAFQATCTIMNKGTISEIRVGDHLGERWRTGNEPDLCGKIIGQSSLRGVLYKINALKLTLLFVKRVGEETI